MQVTGVALIKECENSIKGGILGAPICNDGQKRGILQKPTEESGEEHHRAKAIYFKMFKCSRYLVRHSI